MLGKTHLTIGIASALFAAEPDTLPLLLVSVGAGAVGGLIPDIDVDSTDAHEGASFITVLTVIAVGAVILLDRFMGTGIMARLMSDANRWHTIILVLAFIGVSAYGKGTKHRSFMHSIFALLILTIIFGLIYPPATTAFAAGYASHLLIDILNRKGEQLFFPFEKLFCLDLCDSDGTVNRLLGIAGLAAAVYMIYVFMNQLYW